MLITYLNPINSIETAFQSMIFRKRKEKHLFLYKYYLCNGRNKNVATFLLFCNFCSIAFFVITHKKTISILITQRDEQLLKS